MFLTRNRAVAGAIGALVVALAAAGCGLGTPDAVISAAVTSSDSGAGDADAPQSGAVTSDDAVGGGTSSGDPAGEEPGDDVTGSETPTGIPPADGSTHDASPETSATPSTQGPSGTSVSGLAGVAVSPAQAGETAAGAHAGSGVIAIELDRAHGTTVWEVTVVSAEGRWSVDVDVTSGAILGDRSDDPGEAAEEFDRLQRAGLDHVQAIDAILDTHAGSGLVEMELDDEGGAVVWEAEIITSDHQKYDVTIDAGTGEILKDKLDT